MTLIIVLGYPKCFYEIREERMRHRKAGQARETRSRLKRKETFKMTVKDRKKWGLRILATITSLAVLLMYSVIPLAFAISDRGGRQVTSLDISKDVDQVSAPGYSATLTKTASASYLEIEQGGSAPVSFTISVNASQSNTYHISGDIFVQNTGEWPALVTAVSDTVWYKSGGPTWFPAATSVSTTVPSVIPVGGPHVYSYSGTFTLPVPLSSVTAMSNLIEITISNHPDGTHLFHYRLSFPKPAAAVSSAVLNDVETITPASGLSYAIDSVTVNGVPASLAGPWTLDLSRAPYTVVVNKTLHASAAGDYVLNNRAVLGDLSDEVDVIIHVPDDEEPELGAIEGLKTDSSMAPLAGVEIELWRDGELIATLFTAEDGSYRFEGLEAGHYEVREVVPEGWYAVSADSVHLELEAGATARADFVNERYSSISGNKWNDLNSNGLRDEGEPGLQGVLITLRGEGIEIHAVTAADGSYRFDGLMPGSYTVSETVPAGWAATTPASLSLFLFAGQRLSGIDFLNAQVEVGGIVVEPPQPPAIGLSGDGNAKSLPLTGFEQLPWLLAAALLTALGLAALLLGAMRRRNA